MNNIQSKFSIKDLENLSGIKAHTIRIWEKRYKLLTPSRTDTNIRYYDIENLKKLLNVTYLNNNNYKISKVAKLEETEINELVKDVSNTTSSYSYYIDLLKLAMLNFDEDLFDKTYNELESKFSFTEIYTLVFSPLLSLVGMLWSTNTITPAHEHFIVEIIKHKIIYNIALLDKKNTSKESVYILYLPVNEIHEIGLLFANYNLINHGHNTLYLGQSIPMENLLLMRKHYKKITFVSCFTVKPEREDINKYIKKFNKTILNGTENELLVSGDRATLINNEEFNNITVFETVKQVFDYIQTQA